MSVCHSSLATQTASTILLKGTVKGVYPILNLFVQMLTIVKTYVRTLVITTVFVTKDFAVKSNLLL